MDSYVGYPDTRTCLNEIDKTAPGIVLGVLIDSLFWAIILTGLRLWTA